MAARTIKEISVNSIAEFAKHAELLLGAGAAPGNWYRGQSKANAYTLKPGLFRHPTTVNLEGLIELEARMLDDFQRHSILHVGDMTAIGPDDDLKKLFFMQHYGIPTRLLDWTTNPFIALYFALSGASAMEDAAVWVLNPVKWNRVALEHVSHGDAGPLTHSDALSGYGPRKLFPGGLDPTALRTLGEHAACLLGITNNARMLAQRGVFTVFGRDLRSMEDQWRANRSFDRDALTKILIPAARVVGLLESLMKLGYTDSVSYPDLHGLALEIKRSRGFRV